MKNYLKHSALFFCLLLICSFSVYSQNPDQAKQFFNKTNIAVYKCQKEILRLNTTNFDEDYRSILKLEVEAFNNFNAKNYASVLFFSNACRKKCVELLLKLNITNTTFFENTPEEIEALKTVPVILPASTISPEELKTISTIDIKVPQQTYYLIKNLN